MHDQGLEGSHESNIWEEEEEASLEELEFQARVNLKVGQKQREAFKSKEVTIIAPLRKRDASLEEIKDVKKHRIQIKR